MAQASHACFGVCRAIRRIGGLPFLARAAASLPLRLPSNAVAFRGSLPWPCSLAFSSSSMASSGPYQVRSSKHPKADEPGGGGGRDDTKGGGGGGGDGDYGDSGSCGGPNKNSFLAWYMLLLKSHPVATKAVTSSLLTLLGDIFCQVAVEKAERLDWKRTGIFTSLGLLLVGPVLHFWYLNLSKLIPGPGATKAGLRLMLDQFLFSPVFIGVFFSALLTIEGRTGEIIPKLQQDWLSAVVANWKIWIPFQFLNFLLVPQQLQVLAANVIALAWNVYLSFATHKDVNPPLAQS